MMKGKLMTRIALLLVISHMAVFASCEKPQKEVVEVYARKTSLPGDYGQVFVTVKCSGDWTLALTGETGEVDWANLNTLSGTGDKNNIILTHHRNVEETSRLLTIVLESEAGTVACQLTQASSLQTPENGGNGSGGGQPLPDLPTVQDPTKAKWMELPAMNDSGLDYYSHSFNIDGKTYRNYSFGWSKKDYLAKWVAYPISKFYTNGSYGGYGDWAPNPQVDLNYQPNFGKSFGWSAGYERGHQIANADRKCSAQANIQTYYYTNSTLQHMDFNGKIWAKLEGNMRTVPASSGDTLYVVTGCVVPADPEHIQDPDGRLVPIPEAYFKAALSYSLASTLGTWLGAGFYLEHKTYPYEYISEKEVMTIDELEAKLGMDFFVNLPAKIGESQAADVEAQNPMSFKTVWNIK